MTSNERSEVRTVIKFCSDLGKTPIQTYKMIQTARGKYSVSRSLVFKWHKRFLMGEKAQKMIIGPEDGRLSARQSAEFWMTH
jgi:hypothetical protein